jgi:peptide/nickel transport system substrate-binding protein
MAGRASSLLRDLSDDLRHGRLTRREFLARAMAAGIAAPLALMLVNTIGPEQARAQDDSSGRPSAGTAGQVRGSGGQLEVKQWLPPSDLFIHHAKKLDELYPLSAVQVSSMIVEPLLSFAADGRLLPTLAAKVPTKANRGLSEDLRTVTIQLREGVLWSDGAPFTVDDVVWTWTWLTDPSNAAADRWVWSAVESVEAIDAATVRLSYSKPTLGWYVPLAGGHYGGIIPRHVWSGRDQGAANLEFGANPIGTGPYKIEAFIPEGSIVCSINALYREPNKPYFETVRFQGGGDSATDAEAVLQKGNGDVAPLLLIDPEFLLEIASSSSTGRLIAGVQTEVERIAFNFSDPNREVDGERSSLLAPHPFLTDKRVRQAMALAIDRESIVEEVFVDVGLHPPARNILTGISTLESPNTAIAFDIEAANALLDDAGWVKEGNRRFKDGMELAVAYYTAAGEDSALVKRFRPRIQAAVQEGWEAIGIRVELGRLNGAEFFDASPENEHSYAHFYRDVQMWSSGPLSPFPDIYYEDWYAGPDNRNVAQRSNDWSGWNVQRYVNPAFDALYEEATSTIDPEHAAELFIAMNDIIVEDCVVVPLVARPDLIYAVSNRIATENIGASKWEPLFWNIANWRTVDG